MSQIRTATKAPSSPDTGTKLGDQSSSTHEGEEYSMY